MLNIETVGVALDVAPIFLFCVFIKHSFSNAYAMKFLFQLVLSCLILRGLIACQHSPIKAMEPIVNEPPDPCGLKNVTHRNKIDSIMTAHCKQCHAGRGALKGINLEDYQSTRAWFLLDSARLMSVIRFETGVYMPPVGKIPECEIRQLETWAREGYRE